MLWLCQITFAGVGALTTAQLANNHGWPVLLAVLAGGVVALLMGVVVGLLSIRLGDLYVALVTLTFGLLMENLVFTLPSFVNQGLGLTLNRPGFATSDRAFAYLCLVVFVIIALFIVNFRRSTTGLALNAARWSEAGRQDLGHQRRADEGHCRGTGSSHRRHRRRAVRPGPDDVPAQRVRHVRGRRVAGRPGDDRRALQRRRAARRGLARAAARHRAGLPPDVDVERHARALRPRRGLGGQVPRRRAGRAEPPAPPPGAPPAAAAGAAPRHAGPDAWPAADVGPVAATRVAEHIS